MPKRTAVIDIGSNSARMAIFERSSRLGFHLIMETKSKVRIGEGAYNFGGFLQEIPLERAFKTLQEFKNIIQTLKCSKVLCVATSALRDAPNARSFIHKVQTNLGINITVIDGKKEAYYGAIGAINYLWYIDNATTIDIGGGSTELAKIENGMIVDTISLDLGTVRLKELFFDKKKPLEDVRRFIELELVHIPSHFSSNTLIGIGGTLRSLSKILMEKTAYPLKTVHGYTYDIELHEPFIHTLVTSDVLSLKNLGVRKDRYDTMREGCAIFQAIFQKFNAHHMITSGAGVREGAYLYDLLRSNQHVFPKDFKLSLRSLKDRFSILEKEDTQIAKLALLLFQALKPLHLIDEHFQSELKVAAQLHSIGTKLGFYQNELHGFYFVLNSLNYGFSHAEKVLIAMLIKHQNTKLPNPQELALYTSLLPCEHILSWLSFLLALAKTLHADLLSTKMEFFYKNHTLTIYTQKPLFLAKEQIKQLIKPTSFAIVIKDLE